LLTLIYLNNAHRLCIVLGTLQCILIVGPLAQRAKGHLSAENNGLCNLMVFVRYYVAHGYKELNLHCLFPAGLKSSFSEGEGKCI